VHEEALVRVERPFDGCAVVTLNRPRVLNALSLALRRTLVETFDGLARDEAVRVAVLTGAGRAFCAGVDLKELGAGTRTQEAVVPDASVDPVAAIRRFPWPVIGAVNGLAVTGGFELALACDVLVASREASFADTHGRVGVLPGWGLSQLLPRLIGPYRAKELSFTGNFLPADQAESWGLVNRVVPAEDLLPQTLELARDMLTAVPEMLSGYKQLIDGGMELPLGQALELEKERSRAWALSVRGNDIEARRQEIARRGRAQSGSNREGDE